nr:hypothetical protein BaRGS_017598 [Batillaria attramentaria]
MLNDACDFLATWYEDDQSLVISLKSVFSSGSDVWMAIGFGPDEDMPKVGLSNATGSLEDGIFTCTFHRLLVVAAGSDVFNLTTPYHVLMARGQADGWEKKKHSSDAADAFVTSDSYNLTKVTDIDGQITTVAPTTEPPAPASVSECVISNGQVQAFMSYNKGHSNSRVEPDLYDYVTADSYDLTVVTDINAKLPSYPLVKLHGCLMTLAWVLSGSIGVLVARFYKVTWPNQTVCGVKICGFVIIVADVKGYMIAVGIGTRLFRAQSPEWVTYVVAGFGVWHVLAHAVLEFNKYAERSDSMVGVYKDLQSFSTSYDGRKYQFFRHAIFAMHVAVAVGVCVTVVTAVIGY